MRVIAGEAKGLRLKRPAARHLRPTSDLVRGAIFDILASLGADCTRVLDLYAGSGALGIEALSRGAHWCDFVEQDRAACAIIRENLALAGFQERTRVHCMSVEKALDRLDGPYDLVLMDPPYEEGGAREHAGLRALLASPARRPVGVLCIGKPQAPRRYWRVCLSIGGAVGCRYVPRSLRSCH